VLYRSRAYLLAPNEPYELAGDVPNVVFPCASIQDDKGRLALYYGAADTTVCLAYGYIKEIVDFVKQNNF